MSVNFCCFLRAQRSKVFMDALIFCSYWACIYLFNHSRWVVSALVIGSRSLGYILFLHCPFYLVIRLKELNLCYDSTAIIRGSLYQGWSYSLLCNTCHTICVTICHNMCHTVQCCENFLSGWLSSASAAWDIT